MMRLRLNWTKKNKKQKTKNKQTNADERNGKITRAIRESRSTDSLTHLMRKESGWIGTWIRLSCRCGCWIVIAPLGRLSGRIHAGGRRVRISSHRLKLIISISFEFFWNLWKWITGVGPITEAAAAAAAAPRRPRGRRWLVLEPRLVTPPRGDWSNTGVWSILNSTSSLMFCWCGCGCCWSGCWCGCGCWWSTFMIHSWNRFLILCSCRL